MSDVPTLREGLLASVSIPTPPEMPVVPPPAETPPLPPDQPEITPVRDPPPTTFPEPVRDPVTPQPTRQAGWVSLAFLPAVLTLRAWRFWLDQATPRRV
ncbi:MAG: hypothetical protein K2X11_16885 [Acetobacteraceae bacterium]|nr:hypothetical protein [Acetobacteraceae bacterium]